MPAATSTTAFWDGSSDELAVLEVFMDADTPAETDVVSRDITTRRGSSAYANIAVEIKETVDGAEAPTLLRVIASGQVVPGPSTLGSIVNESYMTSINRCMSAAYDTVSTRADTISWNTAAYVERATDRTTSSQFHKEFGVSLPPFHKLAAAVGDTLLRRELSAELNSAE